MHPIHRLSEVWQALRLTQVLFIDAIIKAIALYSGDAALNRISMTQEPAGWIAHRALLWAGEGSGHATGFILGKAGRRFSEVTLRTGLCSIGANPGFRDIEIDLDNPFFAPDVFDPEGEPRLQSFAEIATALPKKDVFSGLLADGGAASDTTTLGIVARGFLNRFSVKAPMAAKFGVFSSDYGRDQIGIDIIKALPILGNSVFIHQHGRRDGNGDPFEGDHKDQAKADKPQNDLGEETGDAPGNGTGCHGGGIIAQKMSVQ